MLKLVIKDREYFNEDTNEFVMIKGMTLQLEHSLVSISKWESRWKKPYFDKEPKTYTEVIDYIICMTITQNVPVDVYKNLSKENFEEIKTYIEDPMTASTITVVNNKRRQPTKKKKITSELIYSQMFALNIPLECQKWHLNRLITLIEICKIENQGSNIDKMSKGEILRSNTALNAARRARHSTRG
jgi:hypothetical protein